MTDKYKNKYRLSSARLQTWDYGSSGAYFITICTHSREHFFGEISRNISEPSANEPTMQLSEIGKMAEQFWLEIPNHFPFIELGNFVVMPNHVHGILIIDKNENVLDGNVETRQCLVSTNTAGQLRYQNQGKNTISSIVGSYKSVVSKNARLIHADFKWQSRFHDHIIRNHESFERIQKYITNNPMNWKEDRFHPKGLSLL